MKCRVRGSSLIPLGPEKDSLEVPQSGLEIAKEAYEDALDDVVGSVGYGFH